MSAHDWMVVAIILAVFLCIAIGLWFWSDADYDREYQAHEKTKAERDQAQRDHLTTGASLARAEQRIAELEAAVACRDEEITNLEAHIRRQGLFVVGADDPLPVVPADPAARIAMGIEAAREAASLDAEWAEWDGGAS